MYSTVATTSLNFRARMTNLQGDIPKALKHAISLVRLAQAQTLYVSASFNIGAMKKSR
jgi:hypothetical protein